MALFATDRRTQHAYWNEVDSVHYVWQTRSGYFADSEAELVRSTGLAGARRLLEIGCGEGGNLFHLDARPGWVGIDFALPKLAHARTALDVSVCQADAASLPFADGSFDAVLIRDLLHHVPDRVGVLAEAMRVLEPGGAIGVIEPNRNNPLILAQTALVRAERAALVSHAGRIRRELGRAGFEEVAVDHAQPLPVARVVLHPRLGLSQLGRNPVVARALGVIDDVSRRVVPRGAWMYLVGRGRKLLGKQ
jgi:SAM-dependent methyltransferase